MKKVKYHCIFLARFLLLFVLIACQKIEKESLNNMMSKLNFAIETNDQDMLQELIISDSESTPEMAKALSLLLIQTKTGEFKEFFEEHATVLNEINFKFPTASSEILFWISLMPSSSYLASNPEYQEQDGIISYKYPGYGSGSFDEGFQIEVNSTRKGLKFWPVGIPKHSSLIYTSQIISELHDIVRLPSVAAQKKAMHTMFATYVKPTSLQYENREAKGRIYGEQWNMVEGIAYEGNFLEKYKYMIDLGDVKFITKDKCENSDLAIEKFTLQIKDVGNYDLSFDESVLYIHPGREPDAITLSIRSVVNGKVEITIDKESKFMKGKIAAQLDKDNYINGTFTIPICPFF